MSDPIEEAVTEHWGERCEVSDVDDGMGETCPTCSAWRAYDALTAAERRGYLRGVEESAKVAEADAEPGSFHDLTAQYGAAQIEIAAAIRALATKGEPT